MLSKDGLQHGVRHLGDEATLLLHGRKHQTHLFTLLGLNLLGYDSKLFSNFSADDVGQGSTHHGTLQQGPSNRNIINTRAPADLLKECDPISSSMPVPCCGCCQQPGQALQINGAISPGRVGEHVTNEGEIPDLIDEISDGALDARHRKSPHNDNILWIQHALPVRNVRPLSLPPVPRNQSVWNRFKVAAPMHECRRCAANDDLRSVEPLPGQLLRHRRHPCRPKLVQGCHRYPAKPVHAVRETNETPISFPMGQIGAADEPLPCLSRREEAPLPGS